MHTQNSRQAWLDWLRILAIPGVLFFHSAMPYVAKWGWHLKNNQTSNLLLEFNFWLSRFRMPLLFFISGTVAWFMLRKRSVPAFNGRVILTNSSIMPTNGASFNRTVV